MKITWPIFVFYIHYFWYVYIYIYIYIYTVSQWKIREKSSEHPYATNKYIVVLPPIGMLDSTIEYSITPSSPSPPLLYTAMKKKTTCVTSAITAMVLIHWRHLCISHWALISWRFRCKSKAVYSFFVFLDIHTSIFPYFYITFPFQLNYTFIFVFLGVYTRAHVCVHQFNQQSMVTKTIYATSTYFYS